jgi:hypothetical protein
MTDDDYDHTPVADILRRMDAVDDPRVLIAATMKAVVVPLVVELRAANVALEKRIAELESRLDTAGRLAELERRLDALQPGAAIKRIA